MRKKDHKLILARQTLAWLCATGIWSGAASADIVVYRSPRTSTAFVLPEGHARMLPGRSIVFQIPNVGYLRLHADTSRIIKAPTREERFHRMLCLAERQHDVDGTLNAARFALRNGLLDCFYQAARASWKLDPCHPTVQRLAVVEKRLKRPLHDAQRSMARLRRLLPRTGVDLTTSDHYVLMYDADPAEGDPRQQVLVEKRLELLERAYRTFFFKFALEGKLLTPPVERLPIVLFRRQEDYLHYASMSAPNLSQSAGFWSPSSNIAAFVNQDTHQFHRSLRRDATLLGLHSADLVRSHVPGSRDTVQLAGAMGKLADILQDQSDVSVVTHEAVHQLAGNTGLIPRRQFMLVWIHEGLASYFETPAGANWGGAGAVNSFRLQFYRALQQDEAHAKLDFLVSDQIFAAASDEAGRTAAYGQAWALTYFLMEERFDDLIKYYQRISELDASDQGVPREQLVKVFEDSFGDCQILEQQWRRFMSKLDSDARKLLQNPQEAILVID